MKKKFDIFYYEKVDIFVVGESYTTNWLLRAFFNYYKYNYKLIDTFRSKEKLYQFLMTNPKMDEYDFSKIKIINVK